MIALLYAFLIFWGMMQVTFVMYLAVMNAMSHRVSVTGAAWVFIGPLVVTGVLFDFLLNVVFMSVAFLDLPREPLLTARLRRYREDPQYLGGRREAAACWLCEKLLNPFAPGGKHC